MSESQDYSYYEIASVCEHEKYKVPAYPINRLESGECLIFPLSCSECLLSVILIISAPDDGKIVKLGFCGTPEQVSEIMKDLPFESLTDFIREDVRKNYYSYYIESYAWVSSLFDKYVKDVESHHIGKTPKGWKSVKHDVIRN